MDGGWHERVGMVGDESIPLNVGGGFGKRKRVLVGCGGSVCS